jgi:Na+/melibiose symporter-like transporter
MARRRMPDYRDEDVPPLDWWGFVLFGSGILLLSYVLEVLGDHSLPWDVVIALGFAAVLFITLYLLHARRLKAPVLDLKILRIRTFRISVGGGFITRLGVGGMPFLLPLLYQVGLGYAPWQAGLLTMPQAGAAMLMKIGSKPLLERFGHRAVLRVNTVLMGVLISLFSLIGAGTPVWAILLLSFVQGLASSTQFSSMNSLVYADVSNEAASRASSIASTAQQLALSFGVALGSVTAQWFLAEVPQSDHPAFISALHHAFLALGAWTMVSSVSFMGLRAEDGSNVSRHRARVPVAEYGA